MSERMRVVARRSGKWWAIEVPDHPGVVSQARRLDQVDVMAADALSLWLDREFTPDELEVVVHPDAELVGVIEAARRARSRAEEARSEAQSAMRQAVSRAIAAGLPLRDVGRLLGVTHQRAAAIARDIRG